MDDSKVFMFPENRNNGIDATTALLLGNNGGFGNGFNNPLWMMFMYPFILPFFNMFGGGFGNWGNGFGGNNNGVGFLANQLNNDAGRDLILQAINGRADALGQLAGITNNSVDTVREVIATMSTKLSEVGAQVGMSGLQVINSVQSGNASLASQLCECCCNMRQQVTEQGYQGQLRTIEQTNTLGNAISANGRGITDAIADLKTSMISEFCAARERDMQSKIDMQGDLITQLRNQISNDNQTLAFNRAFAALDDKIDAIASKQPNTVPVQWPQLTAVNTTPYVSGGIYGNFNSPFNF